MTRPIEIQPPTTGVAELTRTFDAPIARVFDAWSKPEMLSRWFGPRLYPVTHCELDFRPGGKMSVTMTGPDGVAHTSTGIYQEVVPLERIIWTFGFPGGDPDLVHTTVLFEDLGGKTRVHVRQAFRELTPETEPFARGMQEGWTQTLENLGAYLSGKRHLTRFTTPDATAIRSDRTFDAPLVLVWRAFTDPELLPRWLGPREMSTTIEAMDVRPGGAYRFVQRREGETYTFYGEFREVTPMQRMVRSFCFEGVPGPGAIEVVDFEDLGGGGTRVVTTTTLPTTEARDKMLEEGMDRGANDSHERLDALLATMAGR